MLKTDNEPFGSLSVFNMISIFGHGILTDTTVSHIVYNALQASFKNSNSSPSKNGDSFLNTIA